MRFILRYAVWLLPVLFALSCRKEKVKLPDLTHNYSKRSKKAFGTYTAFRMLHERYKEQGLESVNKDFYTNFINHISGHRNLYIIISKRVLVSRNDLQTMLQYVNTGNQLFIASEYIDDLLLDTLNLKVQYYSISSLFQSKAAGNAPMHYSSVSMSDTVLFGRQAYSYFYFPFDANFVNTDNNGLQPLGLNESGAPNYITVPFGKGRFFLHLNPQAFSNYFLLRDNNKEYLENVFSYTAATREGVYWDDYYRIGNIPDQDFSMFTVFLKYPMLKWALFISMALMLLYISFGSKRRQRPVPVRQPNTNDSVSFVETIGRLYLQKKNNQNIAHKMITYFMEHIRTHYYLNTSQLNAEFFSSLSRKSGVPEKEVIAFFEQVSTLQEAAVVSDEQLLELNNNMQIFLNKKVHG